MGVKWIDNVISLITVVRHTFAIVNLIVLVLAAHPKHAIRHPGVTFLTENTHAGEITGTDADNLLQLKTGYLVVELKGLGQE